MTAAIFVFGIAVASNVRFDIGAGFTVPTQAVFVPMLFAVPVAVVPLLRSSHWRWAWPEGPARRHLAELAADSAGQQLVRAGPALVLLLADDHSPDGASGILLVALAAQFGVDFAAAAVRDWSFGDLSLAELCREVTPIYAIDMRCPALGLVVAFASPGHAEWPVVLIAPLFLVLRVFSKERHDRIADG